MTSTRLRTSLALAIALAAASALPAGAQAATYCVNKPACVTAGGKGVPIDTALKWAAVSESADRIEIGSGTVEGPLAYTGDSPVELVGAGVALTTIKDASSPDATRDVLTLDGPATVRDLTISLPIVDSPGALTLANGAVADGIRVDRTSGSFSDAIGVTLAGGTFRRSTLDFDFTPGTIGVLATRHANVIDDAQIQAQTGVRAWLTGGAKLAVRRSKLSASETVVNHKGGALTLDSDLIDARAAYSGVSTYSEGGATSTAIGRHLTIVGKDGATGNGITAGATLDSTTTFTLRDSIIASFKNPIYRTAAWATGHSDVVLDHVAHGPIDPKADLNANGGTGAIIETAPVPVTPIFVDAGSADFRLPAGSPLIDAGSSTALAAGESATDLVGSPRIADGTSDCVAVRDLGAYERPGADCPLPAAPAATPAATTGGATTTTATTPVPMTQVPPPDTPNVQRPVATNAPPRLTALKATWHKSKATMSLRVDEAAKVRFALQRRTGKRWVTVRSVTVSAHAPSTTKAISFAKPSVRIRVVAMATDSQGLEASAFRAFLVIRR